MTGTNEYHLLRTINRNWRVSKISASKPELIKTLFSSDDSERNRLSHVSVKGSCLMAVGWQSADTPLFISAKTGEELPEAKRWEFSLACPNCCATKMLLGVFGWPKYHPGYQLAVVMCECPNRSEEKDDQHRGFYSLIVIKEGVPVGVLDRNISIVHNLSSYNYVCPPIRITKSSIVYRECPGNVVVKVKWSDVKQGIYDKWTTIETEHIGCNEITDMDIGEKYEFCYIRYKQDFFLNGHPNTPLRLDEVVVSGHGHQSPFNILQLSKDRTLVSSDFMSTKLIPNIRWSLFKNSGMVIHSIDLELSVKLSTHAQTTRMVKVISDPASTLILTMNLGRLAHLILYQKSKLAVVAGNLDVGTGSGAALDIVHKKNNKIDIYFGDKSIYRVQLKLT